METSPNLSTLKEICVMSRVGHGVGHFAGLACREVLVGVPVLSKKVGGLN